MASEIPCSPARDPLSVLFVTRYFHPFTGGLEKRIDSLARGLAGRDIRVTIVTSRLHPALPPLQTRNGVTIHRLVCPRIKVLGASVFICCLVWFLWRHRTRYRFLHVFQVGHSSAAAVLTGRLFGTHTLLHLSGSGPGGDVGRHLKTPWGRLFLAACRRASAIIVLQEQMRRELRAIACPAERIFCIPNGVNTHYYQPTQDRVRIRSELGITSGPIVLYTGRLSAEKGVATLLQAWKLLRDSAPAMLVIVGSGPEQKNVKRLIEHLEIADSVLLMPARDDILPCYHGADVFVMPSFHEGLSNAVLEAMACGLPVIATAVSGTTELVRHGNTGLLVPPDDPEALAAALAELLADPKRASGMGMRGRKHVRTHYTYEDMINRWCALYNRDGC